MRGLSYHSCFHLWDMLDVCLSHCWEIISCYYSDVHSLTISDSEYFFIWSKCSGSILQSFKWLPGILLLLFVWFCFGATPSGVQESRLLDSGIQWNAGDWSLMDGTHARQVTSAVLSLCPPLLLGLFLCLYLCLYLSLSPSPSPASVFAMSSD